MSQYLGVNTVSYLAASVTNILRLKYIVVIQNSVAPGQLYASLVLSSNSIVNEEVNVATLT